MIYLKQWLGFGVALTSDFACFCCFEIKSLILAVLELRESPCLCLLCARIKGIHLAFRFLFLFTGYSCLDLVDLQVSEADTSTEPNLHSFSLLPFVPFLQR